MTDDPHQQLLYTTLIFRAGLSRKEATVGGVRAPSPHAASCGIWASFLESTLHDAKVAYESLFSRCLCSSPSTIDQWVSFFHFLFHFLTFIATWCALWSLVVSPAILVVRPLLLFILRSSEFVSVAVQSVSCFERLVKQPWFPSSDSILIVPFSYITTLQRKKKIGADRGGHWTPPARRKGASDSTASLTRFKSLPVGIYCSTIQSVIHHVAKTVLFCALYRHSLGQ